MTIPKPTSTNMQQGWQEISTDTYINGNGQIYFMDSKPYKRPSFADRLNTWLVNLWNWKTRWAFNHLQHKLKTDPEYREAWHANIAMPIYDATRPKCYCHNLLSDPDARPEHFDGCEIHQANTVPCRFEHREMSIEQAHYIADRLLRHLFGV